MYTFSPGSAYQYGSQCFGQRLAYRSPDIAVWHYRMSVSPNWYAYSLRGRQMAHGIHPSHLLRHPGIADGQPIQLPAE